MGIITNQEIMSEFVMKQLCILLTQDVAFLFLHEQVVGRRCFCYSLHVVGQFLKHLVDGFVHQHFHFTYLFLVNCYAQVFKYFALCHCKWAFFPKLIARYLTMPSMKTFSKCDILRSSTCQMIGKQRHKHEHMCCKRTFTRYRKVYKDGERNSVGSCHYTTF